MKHNLFITSVDGTFSPVLVADLASARAIVAGCEKCVHANYWEEHTISYSYNVGSGWVKQVWE